MKFSIFPDTFVSLSMFRKEERLCKAHVHHIRAGRRLDGNLKNKESKVASEVGVIIVMDRMPGAICLEPGRLEFSENGLWCVQYKVQLSGDVPSWDNLPAAATTG
ncbi:unnamed protein product [Dovyalis caffra]|uniref:Uncharacterized protein n=1 Tax=Dovyalis caffra TaxID=77055 RepID=A0AAV1S8U9_9ROSI|nr:unnamed protein product [Dovyalis caffra]